MIKAEAVGPNSTYESVMSGQIQSDALVPIAGLKFTLTAINLQVAGRPGRPATYFVFTNSSGEGYVPLPRGNYSVQAVGADFSFNRTLGLSGNLTTVLDVDVIPVPSEISSIELLNQDTVAGVETTATLFIEVSGSFDFTSGSTYQVIGMSTALTKYVSPAIGKLPLQFNTPVAINITIIGVYPSPSGEWVVGVPVGSSPYFPTTGIFLLRYEANSTVTYSGA